MTSNNPRPVAATVERFGLAATREMLLAEVAQLGTFQSVDCDGLPRDTFCTANGGGPGGAFLPAGAEGSFPEARSLRRFRGV